MSHEEWLGVMAESFLLASWGWGWDLVYFVSFGELGSVKMWGPSEGGVKYRGSGHGH